MLNIRLSRRGKKKQPSYRIIVLEKRKDPRGDFLEDLGYYNPFSKKRELKKERIKYWLSKGAQPSNTVHNLLVDEKIISAAKVKIVKLKKKQEVKEEQAAVKEKKISSPDEAAENEKQDLKT